MIYFYCTSWQFFHIIVKWRISPTTEQIMFTFSILLFHFYSHIPCGMWLSYIWSIKITKIISTHTSRVGCDRYTDWSEILVINFYSHIPCGMWLQSLAKSLHHQHISTHTSRVGCDYNHRVFLSAYENFYSHIPCGMWRTGNGDMFIEMTNFYSHIPCGMWRRWCQMLRFEVQISTHTSRVGCDRSDNTVQLFGKNFYSHIPCGMWPSSRIFSIASPTISTHTSRVGCDLHCQTCITCSYISTHTSRVGCD